MGAARIALRRMPEPQFWKLFGSGSGEGFTPVPNTQVWGILTTWKDEATARRMSETAPVFRDWAKRADETFTVFLSATSTRGEWSRRQPFQTTEADNVAQKPVAVLTRASIKVSALPRFWGREPEISKAIGEDPNVIFKIGIGEVPWLHQVTFSIWPDVQSMTAFARRDGPHARAIRAVREGGWFREELYARFNVLGSTGTWEGHNPLQTIERQAA